MQPFRIDAEGLLVQVRVTPRAQSDSIVGTEMASHGRPHIAARVRAVPDKGSANAAVTRLLAQWLGVPKASVSIASGSTSRLKTLRVSGEAAQLSTMIQARLTEPVSPHPKKR